MSGRAGPLPKSHQLLEGRSRQMGQPAFSYIHNENCSIRKQGETQAKPESEPAGSPHINKKIPSSTFVSPESTS